MMAVGKAEAHPLDRAAETGFRCVVPCLNSLGEAEIRDHLARDQFFWLDLTAPTVEDIEKLRELFGFHPLALEDALHFGQRPKLDHYQDYVFIVFYGAREHASPDENVLREVQMFISGKYLVSLHEDSLPVLDEQRSRLKGVVLHSEQFLLYRVFDALTDSFFPVLARMDNEIDELEVAVLAGPTDEQLQRLFALKRSLVAMRKVVTPQRDLFARSIDQLSALDGQQPPERGDEAARDRGHHLPSAVVHHGLLRHELRLDGAGRDRLDVVVLRAGPRQPVGDVRVPRALLQAQGLDVAGVRIGEAAGVVLLKISARDDGDSAQH